MMARDVICLAKSAKPSDVEALISKCDHGECSHHAFPVIDSVDHSVKPHENPSFLNSKSSVF